MSQVKTKCKDHLLIETRDKDEFVLTCKGGLWVGERPTCKPCDYGFRADFHTQRQCVSVCDTRRQILRIDPELLGA